MVLLLVKERNELGVCVYYKLADVVCSVGTLCCASGGALTVWPNFGTQARESSKKSSAALLRIKHLPQLSQC